MLLYGQRSGKLAINFAFQTTGF